ncbi:MAG: FeoA family protein [Eubacteriales bacterium]|jgi:ferrous iron transport protein A|nr:FeoA family protein [Eubacteriales bacterium]MDD4106313.1 FeoA family protein [Eubacteriales bacterium]MDD4711680.1 FeoA family protein [Eubacteriales bacterium]
MPLYMITPGSCYRIQKVTGKTEIKQFLEKLGFVPGETVSVVCENFGNLIVNIKESRVAISREMALKIVV